MRDPERPQETTPRAPLERPVKLADLPSSMFDGVEREATCACGRTFTQMQMADREMDAMQRMDVIGAFLATVPERFVPVHCPPCETQDLGRQALIDEGRARSRETGTASVTYPDRRQG